MPTRLPPVLRQGENVTGNGSASPDDLIIAQDAILAATGAAQASVNLLRRDMTRTLTGLRKAVGTVDTKVGCLDVRLDAIESARKIEAALAEERQTVAAKAEADHAAKASQERKDAADLAVATAKTSETNLLTRHWRISLAVAALFSAGSLFLGILNFVTSR